MTTLYAQPYDISATGFYFETVQQYEEHAAKAVNDYGEPVEEFEIQFIDGEAIDAALAKAWEISQGNIAAYLEAVEDWEYHSKVRFIIAMEQGIRFDPAADDIDLLDVDIHSAETLRELAEQFVDDGYYGDIPEALSGYIDYDAIARDLAMDYAETVIAGEPLVYRCE